MTNPIPTPARGRRLLIGLGLATATVVSSVAPATAVPNAEKVAQRAIRAQAHAQVPVEQAQRAEVQAASERVAQRQTPPGQATDTTRTLDAALAKMVSDGAVGAVARVDGRQVSWAGAAGVRNRETGAPAQRQDQFRAASNTKMMVATLALQEVQRRNWRLDQRVDEIIPGLFPGHRDVTIQQLLSHTGGVPNGSMELILGNLDVPDPTAINFTPQQQIDAVNAVPWTAPGEYLYSNAGYVALGLLLEAENDRPIAQLMKERIWRTAGMRHTYLDTDPGLTGPALDEYLIAADGYQPLPDFQPNFFWVSGNVVTTTKDLNAFTRALLSGHLVRRSLVNEMLAPVLEQGRGYGLGVYTIPDPCPAPGALPYFVGHDGATFGTLSIAFSSADGRRQISLAGTGRDYSNPTDPTAARWNLGTAMQPMVQATC